MTKQVLSCRICKAEGRPHFTHSLADCDYVSKAEKKQMIRSFRVDADCDDQEPLENLADDIEDAELDDEA